MWNYSSPPDHASLACNMFSVSFTLSLSTSIVESLLVLPLSLFVLYHGYRRWKLHRSFRTASHSDFFTYHMAVMQLAVTLGDAIYFGGAFTDNPELIRGGTYVSGVIYPGELLIHSLTCMDRYLAVVYPITYMKLKQSIGVWIRNISISVVWLLSLGYVGVKHLYYPEYPHVLYACLLMFALLVVCFCSISVLCVLVRPKPGEMDRVDHSKRKAFHTMTAITATLLIWFIVILINVALDSTVLLQPIQKCILFEASTFFNIPCSLVLGMLLLQRAGKFTFGKK